MKIQKSAIICCFAAAGLLFASCKKDTPRTEQKAENTPAPVVQPETPKVPGEARVAVSKAGGLEAALKGEDLEKLTKLVVTSGSLNQADLAYITKSLKIEEIDLTNATLSLQDDEKGFSYNTTLKKIIAPANIEKTQMEWFSNTKITELIFPGDKLRVFGGATYNEKLASLSLPNSVEEIGERAFEYSNFESITLSSKLKAIPAEAFKYCRRLTQITIPASVTEVGALAFAKCEKLKTITFLCPAPKFTANADEENAFTDYDFLSIEPTITVPKDTKKAYFNALGLGPRGQLAKRFVEAE